MKEWFSKMCPKKIVQCYPNLEFPYQTKCLINEQVNKCFPFSPEFLNHCTFKRAAEARSVLQEQRRLLSPEPSRNIPDNPETCRGTQWVPQQDGQKNKKKQKKEPFLVSSWPDAITVSLNQTATSPLWTLRSTAQRKDQSQRERGCSHRACKEAGGANKMG